MPTVYRKADYSLANALKVMQLPLSVPPMYAGIMNEPTRQCRQCHARIALASAEACPACGGILIPEPGSALEPSLAQAGSAPRVIDHRGIVLPPRHAVGGVITPR
jgi:hypothetical protein